LGGNGVGIAKASATFYIKTMNKYNNIPTICSLNHKHPSKGEAQHCQHIHLWLSAPQLGLKSIEYEKEYDLHCNGIKVCTHRPDWTMNYIDRVEVIEYKGVETPLFKLKHKMYLAEYPHIKYNMVKQKVRIKGRKGNDWKKRADYQQNNS